MASREVDLYALIVEMRRGFNALKAYSDQANADLGVTASMRAVMEHLAEHGPTSVPEIARAKDVTRQHIQQVTDGLEAARMVAWRVNPRHKRSALAVLTSEGDRTFAEIKRREAAVLSSVCQDLPTVDFAHLTENLSRVRSAIARQSQT
jgi:DNA-binding MarR family transcriptional regulator